MIAKPPPQPVYEVLGRSRARLERQAGLGDALRLVQWHNSSDRMVYTQPGHHTLSVYLQGGQHTHLVGRPAETGAPGRYCVLPAEHESHWHIEGSLRFVHLYLSELAWADRIVRLLDAEPRAHTLEQRIFAEDAALSAWAVRVAALDWQDDGQRLQAQQLSHAALDRLVLLAARPRARQAAQRQAGGGLGRLAALAHLSEFHFARMFRVSMACSVHGWITQRRLARAQALLRDGKLPLAQVASACGFASASHLSQRLRSQLGTTPGQFRRATMGA